MENGSLELVKTLSAYVLRKVIELMGIISVLFKESAYFLQRLFVGLLLCIAHRHDFRPYLPVALCKDEADNSREHKLEPPRLVLTARTQSVVMISVTCQQCQVLLAIRKCMLHLN